MRERRQAGMSPQRVAEIADVGDSERGADGRENFGFFEDQNEKPCAACAQGVAVALLFSFEVEMIFQFAIETVAVRLAMF